MKHRSCTRLQHSPRTATNSESRDVDILLAPRCILNYQWIGDFSLINFHFPGFHGRTRRKWESNSCKNISRWNSRTEKPPQTRRCDPRSEWFCNLLSRGASDWSKSGQRCYSVSSCTSCRQRQLTENSAGEYLNLTFLVNRRYPVTGVQNFCDLTTGWSEPRLQEKCKGS